MPKNRKTRASRPANVARKATNGQHNTHSPVASGVAAGLLTRDAIVNQLARIGTIDTLLSQNDVQASHLTSYYGKLDTMYRSNWIARRVVDTIAMMRQKTGMI